MKRLACALWYGLCSSCGVPEPAAREGTTTRFDDDGCGRGVAVVHTDYQSTNVSLLDSAGAVLTRSFISSADAASELSAPLTGDVVLPNERQSGSELVLIDRYPAAVLSFIDLETEEVRAQLSVATGFAANPHDYLELSPQKAYVSRFERNLNAGRVAFDEGADVLIVDPSAAEIAGRIALFEPPAEPDRPLPRPDRMLKLGERVVLLVNHYTLDYVDSESAELVVIDPERDRVLERFELEGLHGCSDLAASPSGDELAVICSGGWGGDSVPDAATAGVVRIATEPDFSERQRYATEHFGAPPGASVAYASDSELLLTTLGRFAYERESAEDDTLQVLELRSGQTRVLARSAADPFTLGEVTCVPSCRTCFVADAGRGVVHRVRIEPELEIDAELKIDDGIGLPPRQLGRF